MLNGLYEIPVAMLARNAAFTTDIRPLIGILAAVLAAMLAGQASWHITDRIIAWRKGGDQDGF